MISANHYSDFGSASIIITNAIASIVRFYEAITNWLVRTIVLIIAGPILYSLALVLVWVFYVISRFTIDTTVAINKDNYKKYKKFDVDVKHSNAIIQKTILQSRKKQQTSKINFPFYVLPILYPLKRIFKTIAKYRKDVDKQLKAFDKVNGNSKIFKQLSQDDLWAQRPYVYDYIA